MKTATMFFRCGSFEFKVGGHVIGGAEYRRNQAYVGEYGDEHFRALSEGGKRVSMAYRDPTRQSFLLEQAA